MKLSDIQILKHGAWEVSAQEENQQLCKCSLCSEILLVYDGWHQEHKLPNYCPFCGARMDGEN